MNKEQIKLKIQRLVNQYNAANYVHVIKETGILLKKLPNNLFLMNLIGSSFQKIGQLEKAKKIFEDIIALDNSNTAALNNLGNTHKLLKDFEAAERNYKQALQIDPNFANSLQNLANLKFDLNNYDDAIELYKKAIKSEPKNFLTYYTIRKSSLSSLHLNKIINAYLIYSNTLKFNYFYSLFSVLRLYFNALKKKYL